ESPCLPRCSPSPGRPTGAVARRRRSRPGSPARRSRKRLHPPTSHGPAGTGADLTRTRVSPSLAHVCKKGSQTLRVVRVDVGQRSETVHRANLSAIVRGLHEHGPQSRSDLVAGTGLTRSAIRALVGELAAAGLVTEGSAVRLGTPGRPSPLVRLNSTGAAVLSLEILVDSIAAAIVGLGGETLEHVRLERPRGEPSVADAVTAPAPLA